MFPASAQLLSYNMHLNVSWFPSMTFGYSNRDSQQFGPSLSNSECSRKFKNLLIPFQGNKFSLPIFICRLFCDTLREAHRSYFLIPIFVNIHHCTINNLSAAFPQQHKLVTQNQLKNIRVIHGSLSHSLLLWYLSSVSIYAVIMLLHEPLAQSYAVSHWCPFCTIHFTKWIHCVLGEVHFSDE